MTGAAEAALADHSYVSAVDVLRGAKAFRRNPIGRRRPWSFGLCALCLPCAGLADLEFLPAGDTALTRRAAKYSPLAEPAAIEKAEQEGVEDADERAANREHTAQRGRRQS